MARRPRTSSETSSETPPAKKTRTREHVIASQSVVHVERFVFARGFTAERVIHDYGYDLNVYTYDADGGIENGNIYIQLKATDNLPILRDGKTISLTVDRVDVAFWQNEIMPVILVVYDAQHEEAYWLYVQEWLENMAPLQEPTRQAKIKVRLTKNNVLTEATIEQFRTFKRIVLDQGRGHIKHHG